MSQLPDVITLGPEEEAQRLWDGAVKANEKTADSLVALCESIEQGLPLLATCAGLILLARQVHSPDQESLDLILEKLNL